MHGEEEREWKRLQGGRDEKKLKSGIRGDWDGG